MSEEQVMSTSSNAGTGRTGKLLPGIGAGAISAVIGAMLWAAITVATHYQIGFMAVGVGVLVGFGVRSVGQGSTQIFGIAGGALALFGCLLGNLLSSCGFVAVQEHMGIFEVLSRLDISIAVSLIHDSFDVMDVVFYAIAIYEGFKLSLVRE